MRFGNQVSFVYAESWAFARRGWWLAILPSLPLLAYALSGEVIPNAWGEAAVWSAVGLTAVMQAALSYCVMRFVALEHDLTGALSVNQASARTFTPYLVAMSALNLIPLLGMAYDTDAWTSLGLALPGLLIFPLLSPWSVTAPSGSAVIGPVRSVRLVLPHLMWAVVFFVLASLPLIVAQVVAYFALVGIFSAFPNYAPPVIDAAFTSCHNVISLIALFVIADRAGVRIGADRSLAAVFD